MALLKPEHVFEEDGARIIVSMIPVFFATSGLSKLSSEVNIHRNAFR
jgi:hypothetical protein